MAHEDIQSDGTAKNQREKINEFLQKFPDGLTRNEISGLLGIRINAVCGRCKELIKSGKFYEDGKKIDQFSKKMNYILKSWRLK